jgi:2Fe-2S ferredoxin
MPGPRPSNIPAMPRLTFIQPDGSRRTVDAALGQSVMEAARSHDIRGIRAECGGECACSTCHCYVESAWIDRLPAARDDEAGLIEFAWEPRTGSRLTCQLVVTEAFDGLVLHLPERQL